MFELGQKISFIVNLPIGQSGKCEGKISKIYPPRNNQEGPSFLVTDIIEIVNGGETIHTPNYRIDTLPDGNVDDGTIIL